MKRRNQRRRNGKVGSASLLTFAKRAKRKPAAFNRRAGTRPRSESKPLSVSYLFFLLLVVVFVAGSFVYHLNVRFEGVWLGYETSRARAERARLLVEQRELRLELASLKSPARIETEAREKLGMTIPDHNRIIPIGRKQTTVMASGRVR